MEKAPIKSQKEADEVRNWLIKTTADVMKISIDESTKRVTALFKSGILDGGSPQDPKYQMMIDAFLAMPSENYAHLK